MVSIENMLCPDSRGVLSLIGGGGKTSLMFHLARLLARSGKSVLTTTTTKMLVPSPDQSATVLVDADPEVILRLACSRYRESLHLTAAMAHLPDTGKLKGFAPEAVRTFADSGRFDWILVEADGSAQHPLKAHADHEPVVPPETTILVSVAGLDALGKPLSEDWVFRSDKAGPIMGLSMGDTITPAALAQLFSGPLGYTRYLPSRARHYIFLNKADTRVLRAGGDMVAAQLRQMSRPVAEDVIIGQALNEVRVYAVHHLTRHS